MAKKARSREEILTMLADAPPRISAATATLTPAQCQSASAPDTWSINEVLAHLRACADMWGGSIAAILDQDRPTLRAINPRTWIAKTDYPEQAFQLSLSAFTAQRTELLAVLEPLDAAGWARSATVLGAGKALERTVHFYAQWLAEHERAHLKQIERSASTLGS